MSDYNQPQGPTTSCRRKPSCHLDTQPFDMDGTIVRQASYLTNGTTHFTIQGVTCLSIQTWIQVQTSLFGLSFKSEYPSYCALKSTLNYIFAIYPTGTFSGRFDFIQQLNTCSDSTIKSGD